MIYGSGVMFVNSKDVFSVPVLFNLCRCVAWIQRLLFRTQLFSALLLFLAYCAGGKLKSALLQISRLLKDLNKHLPSRLEALYV